jgi:hypothetical protein
VQNIQTGIGLDLHRHINVKWKKVDEESSYSLDWLDNFWLAKMELSPEDVKDCKYDIYPKKQLIRQLDVAVPGIPGHVKKVLVNPNRQIAGSLSTWLITHDNRIAWLALVCYHDITKPAQHANCDVVGQSTSGKRIYYTEFKGHEMPETYDVEVTIGPPGQEKKGTFSIPSKHRK